MKTQMFNKIRQDIFTESHAAKPLFVLEIANNHMGDVSHGETIIKHHAKVISNFPFYFGFKFQFRDISTFIHPQYKNRLDIPYVKRFTETTLSDKEIKKLLTLIDTVNCISIATPFDEASVDRIENLQINCIKIASYCSTDWPLLERVVATDKPIIVSIGGIKLEDVDRTVSFLKHRNKQFALLHCIGEYPTEDSHLQLHQIDILKERYPGVVIGFSTHEVPSHTIPVQLAIAKNSRIFEKHIGVQTDKYPLNAYSATPENIKNWLTAAEKAYTMMGNTEERKIASLSEQADFLKFRRGVFAKTFIAKGEKINPSNLFYAFPNEPGQLVSNDISKYVELTAIKNIEINQAISSTNVVPENIHERVLKIVRQVQQMVTKDHIPFPSEAQLEISHHYGLENFYKFGAILITVINRDYCKKLIILMKGQTHPVQYHKKKEETFHILQGTFTIVLNGKKRKAVAGDVITIEKGMKHAFSSPTGGILEEISSTHFVNDSFYEDETIMKNKHRKTIITYWLG